MNNRRITGARGEEYIARVYKKAGFQILARNYTCRFGEIDLIAADGAYLVFCEVKLRAEGGLGTPAMAVDRHKQQKILQTARVYLSQNPTNLQPRFDVAEVYTRAGDIIRHQCIENAFGE